METSSRCASLVADLQLEVLNGSRSSPVLAEVVSEVLVLLHRQVVEMNVMQTEITPFNDSSDGRIQPSNAHTGNAASAQCAVGVVGPIPHRASI